MAGIADLMNVPFGGTEAAANANPNRAKKLGYIRQEGVISLSFSRMETLHSCPRKFMLRELHERAAESPSIHLAFGSAFGAGMAELWRTNNIERAAVVALSHWDYDDWDNKYARGKSFGECIRSLRLFHANILPQLAEEWELAYIDGKPAIELLFYIRISETYDYQGHIDVILKNKITNQLAVLECKTASKEQTSSNWQNSEQALGYYYTLQWLAQKLGLPAATEVIYLTLEVGKWSDPESNWGFKIFPFMQNEYSEAEFLGGLFSAIHTLDFFIEHKFFPKRGKACNAYGRTCEFFGACDFAMLTGETKDPTQVGNVYEVLHPSEADFYIDLTGKHPNAGT